MSTRKPVKKVVRKVAKKVTTKAVSEVFQTNPAAPETVSVPRNAVLLFVNGSDKGQIDTTGQKLQDFVTSQAQRYGIRSFSVYADGRKIDTSEAQKSMSAFSKVEIVAKDARG